MEEIKFLGTKSALSTSTPFLSKIKLSDNKKLTDSEFEIVKSICEIFCAIDSSKKKANIIPPSGGIFWFKSISGPFELYKRINRAEIDHSFLFNTRFRDFPTLAYESDIFTPVPDFWVRKYYRLVQGIPPKWQVKIPARFGEIGWNYQGYPVNRLSCINQERILVLLLSGIADYLSHQKNPQVLEIGGGGGEMGYTLSTALPNLTWYNCDLLGSLIYSTIRLAILLPNKNHYIYVGNLELPNSLNKDYLIRCPNTASQLEDSIISIPHFLVDDFKEKLKINFGYNAYSFGEMSSTVVSHYAELLSHFLKDKGVLFEQNGNFHEVGGCNVESTLSQKFRQYLPRAPFDGRFILNGPVRIWLNNKLDQILEKYQDPESINHIVKLFNDFGDQNDISFPFNAWEILGRMFPNGH